MNDRYFCNKTGNSEFVLRNGNIEYFRICEAEYMTVKARYGRISQNQKELLRRLSE